MIVDGVYYPVIHFCRVILSRMVVPFCIQSFLAFSYEYRVIFTSTFVSGCLQTPVSPLQCYAINNTFFISYFQDSQLFPLARVF